MTTAISIMEFHAKTEEILDLVIETEETVIVVLINGRKFALVPVAEYERLEKMTYLGLDKSKPPNLGG